MKKAIFILSSVLLIIHSLGAQAHGFQHNRGGYNHYSNSYGLDSSYPATGLIANISFRNYYSRAGLQNRLVNSRISNHQSYRHGYRNGYRDGRRSTQQQHRNDQYHRSNCYEIFYDRHGKSVQRRLASNTCRH